MDDDGATLLDEVSVTEARRMRQHYDNVVHGKRPFLMTRYRDPGAVVMSREDLARVLRRYRFTVDLLPEDDGSFTLWIPELGVGESGETIKDARRALLEAVRAYARHYWDRYDAWQHIPAKSAQWPYILRLSLARDDRELLAMLLEAVPRLGTAPDPDGSNLWKKVWHDQLQLASEDDFWAGLDGQAVRYNLPPAPQAPEALPRYLEAFLRDIEHLTPEQIAAISVDEAKARWLTYHSRELLDR